MPSVPIVVLSANAEIEDKVLLLELGAKRLRHQAFSPRELLRSRAPRHAPRTRRGAHGIWVAAEDVDHELRLF